MSIKPIDLQTNMSQIHEVSKAEHTRMEAMIEQQQLIAKESDEKSRLVNARLDEAKKTEGSIVRNEKQGGGRGSGPHGKESGNEEKEKEGTAGRRSKDDRMGKIIDVLK